MGMHADPLAPDRAARATPSRANSVTPVVPVDVTRTARWQRTRRQYAARLPLPCPYCGHPVETWQAWDLDHYELPRAHGGTYDRLRPAHARCNRMAGAAIRRGVGVTAPPSRAW
jgi:hypothetical protein